MRPIIIVMLLVDIGVFLAAAFAIALRADTASRGRPIWSSFAISLLITGNVSIQIANDHPGKQGADILNFVGPMLIGMAIMCVLMLLRDRRAARPETAS
jgi:hypothetical protein